MRRGLSAGILVLIAILLSPLQTRGDDVVDEVFLLLKERELLAFSALGNRWVTLDLRSGEKVLDSQYGGHVAVAVTNFRILGFSALTNRWAEEKLTVGELIVTLNAEGNVGAAITNLRAFGFNANTGAWIVKRFELK
jgi:hypothetical protein